MNKLKLGSFFLASLVLCACDGISSSDDFHIYKHMYDNGKYFEKMKESADSEKDIYVTTAIVDNSHEGEPIEVLASDFKLVVDKKEYPALFFVEQWKFEGNNISGTKTYAAETSEKKTFSFDEDHLKNLSIAFETFSKTEFSLIYKGNTLKALGE